MAAAGTTRQVITRRQLSSTRSLTRFIGSQETARAGIAGGALSRLIGQRPLPRAGRVGNSCNFGRSVCIFAPVSFRHATLASGPSLYDGEDSVLGRLVQYTIGNSTDEKRTAMKIASTGTGGCQEIPDRKEAGPVHVIHGRAWKRACLRGLLLLTVGSTLFGQTGGPVITGVSNNASGASAIESGSWV